MLLLSDHTQVLTFRADQRPINNYYFLKNNHAPVSVSPDLVKPSTSLSFAGIPAVLMYDTLGVLARCYDQQAARSADLAIQNWSGEETVTTGYAKLSIDTDLGPVPVRGNLGVQVIGVKQSSDGLAVDGDKITPLHGGSDYRDAGGGAAVPSATSTPAAG